MSSKKQSIPLKDRAVLLGGSVLESCAFPGMMLARALVGGSGIGEDEIGFLITGMGWFICFPASFILGPVYRAYEIRFDVEAIRLRYGLRP